MRAVLLILALATVLPGCKPETARPAPADGPARHSTISSGPVKEQPRPADAATDLGADAEPMSPEKAREAVPEQEAGSTGILKVLKDSVEREKTPNVLTPGGDFDEDEMKAIEEALGTLEKKPPPPLEAP